MIRSVRVCFSYALHRRFESTTPTNKRRKTKCSLMQRTLAVRSSHSRIHTKHTHSYTHLKNGHWNCVNMWQRYYELWDGSADEIYVFRSIVPHLVYPFVIPQMHRRCCEKKKSAFQCDDFGAPKKKSIHNILTQRIKKSEECAGTRRCSFEFLKSFRVIFVFFSPVDM